MRELAYLNKYLLKYKWKLILGFLITIVARIFYLFLPRLIGNSLSSVEKYLRGSVSNVQEIKETLLINIVIIIGSALISGFFTFLMRQTIINVSRFIEFDLKNEVFSHYQRLTQRFYKNNRTGDLMNRISEDVSKVRMYVGPALMYSINTTSLFILVISYMVSIAPVLTLYTIIPLPVLSIIIYRLSRVINIRSTAVQELLSKLSSFSQESFSGISVIKSYNLQKKMMASFEDLSQESYEKNINLVRVQAWFFPLMILLIGFSNLIVIFIGGKQYINGQIEIGVLAEFIIYVNLLTWPVATVGWVTSVIQQAEASQKRINAFLNEKPNIKNGNGVDTAAKGIIRFKEVSLRYPETDITALKNINFSIQPGETLGIIGKIGSGKSTILDLISRLYDPDSGTVLIDGHPVTKYGLEELRSLIGYVPQNAFLFSDTIENNIRFGDEDATEEAIIKAAENAAIAANIRGFSKAFKTVLGERGVTLSGGQIQRISIARALIKDPKILLFDDCLSAVDTDTEEEILSNLKRFCKDKTTIIVSHRISSIKAADQIIVLENGKIIQQGNHKDLIKNPGYYRDLHQKQQSEKVN